MNKAYQIRPVTEQDRALVARLVSESWGSEIVISRGQVHRPAELPGFIAEEGGEVVGLLTYHIVAGACEVVTLAAVRPFHGIGTQLLAAVQEAARDAGCHRLWLITTNDNLPALRFYQRRGFVLAALHAQAIAESRRIKPAIPLIGLDGIPIRDEIELAMNL